MQVLTTSQSFRIGETLIANLLVTVREPCRFVVVVLNLQVAKASAADFVKSRLNTLVCHYGHGR
ncbi:MAG: hypothetical protein ACR2NP_16795, partial [Pirellulaceae bacterium]